MKLVGMDANAFAILGRFRQAAKADKWPEEEIQKVIDDAMSSSYDHLLSVISKHCLRGGF